MELCKVIFDGCHYLAQPYTNVSRYSTKEIIELDKKELGLSINEKKKDLFINEWAEVNFPFKNKGRKKESELHQKVYNTLKESYYLLYYNDVKGNELKDVLKASIMNDIELMKYFKFDRDILDKAIRDFIINQKETLKKRKALFKRKALNNDWSYFVTFTYDDKKHTEDSFVKALKRKLQNYHTNYGWLYMGCFERSKTGRLHFHGLLYVPEGAMRGMIEKVDYYDTTAHKKAVSYINSEFELKIGRNDFKPITNFDFTFKNALNYILKYIGKSNNKIIYSRGIKDSVMGLVDFENKALCKVSKNSPFYVLIDNEYIEVSKDLDMLEREI